MAQWQKRSETQEEFCFTFLKLESKSIITEDHFTYETSKHQTSNPQITHFLQSASYPDL